MKLNFKLLLIITFFNSMQSTPETIISVSLKKYPYFKPCTKKNVDVAKYSKKLQQPDYVYKQVRKHLWSSGVPGIMALYAGNVSLSDQNGMLQFPRLQQQKNIYLLISNGVKFNPDYIIAPSTIHNWGMAKEDALELDTTKNYAIYAITFKQDKQLNLFYFDTQKAVFPDIEDKNTPKWRNGRYVIPLNTIIIVADPESIFVPIGATVTPYSPNLLLPPIYIKKNFCFVYNSLFTLGIKQYFSQETSSYQQENQSIAHIQQRI